ncbi:hypothetical protein D3C74_423850 [compost metagenome]
MRKTRSHADDNPLALQPAFDFSQLRGGKFLLLRKVRFHLVLLAHSLPKLPQPVVKSGDSVRLQRRNIRDAELLLQSVAHISA